MESVELSLEQKPRATQEAKAESTENTEENRIKMNFHYKFDLRDLFSVVQNCIRYKSRILKHDLKKIFSPRLPTLCYFCA